MNRNASSRIVLTCLCVLVSVSAASLPASGADGGEGEVIYTNDFEKPRWEKGAGRNNSSAFVARKGYGCGGFQFSKSIGPAVLDISLWAKSEPGGHSLKAPLNITSTEGAWLGLVQEALWNAPLSTTYQKYRFRVTVPFVNTGATSLVFYRAPDQTLYVDDIVIRLVGRREIPSPRPEDRVELLTNGSFESPVPEPGGVEGWSVSPSEKVEVKVLSDQADAPDGRCVIHVKSTAERTYITCSSGITLTPSVPHVMECWVKGKNAQIIFGQRGARLPAKWAPLRMVVGQDRRYGAGGFALRINKSGGQEECELFLDGCSLFFDRTQLPPQAVAVPPASSAEDLRKQFLALAKRGGKGVAFANRASSFDEVSAAEQPGSRGMWLLSGGARIDGKGGRKGGGALLLPGAGIRAGGAIVRIPEYDRPRDYFYPGEHCVSFYAKALPGATGKLELTICRALRDEKVEKWRFPLAEDSSWTYCEAKTKVPEGLCDGFMRIGYSGKGKVWVDDFRLSSEMEIGRSKPPLLRPIDWPLVEMIEGPKPGGG